MSGTREDLSSSLGRELINLLLIANPKVVQKAKKSDLTERNLIEY